MNPDLVNPDFPKISIIKNNLIVSKCREEIRNAFKLGLFDYMSYDNLPIIFIIKVDLIYLLGENIQGMEY